MVNLSPEICFKLRDARRSAKISQGDLALEVGCKQSAISMFEQGRPTKLNSEAVERIAEKFGIDLKQKGTEQNEAPAIGFDRQQLTPNSGFCPNPMCPSNQRYEVDGRVFLLPDREKSDPVGGRFCAFCGESLERRCPNCGAPVHAGAICSLCGEPYIAL